MYSTCIYCHSSLGYNESIAHCQVGRRLAFDIRRGRLWAICGKCGGWNLVPIEERWEAIEECEALFELSQLRISTENIGLAAGPHRLELIRVGSAAYPEFAGWRYGRWLRRRRARLYVTMAATAIAGTVATIVAGTMIVALATVVGIVALAPLAFAWDWIQSYLDDRVVAHIHPPDGHVRRLLEEHIGQVELLPPSAGEPWGISIAHRSGSLSVRGAAAKQLASQLLARLNHRGASKQQVAHAVDLISNAGGPDGYVTWATKVRESRRRGGEVFRDSEIGALALTDIERLALEMAVNEDVERSALEGELEALRAAWVDAEEVARIADDLLVPARIRLVLERFRGTAPG